MASCLSFKYGYDDSYGDHQQAPWERVGETYSESYPEDLSFENVAIPEAEPLFVEATQKIAATPSLLLRVLADGTVRHVSGSSLSRLGLEKKDLLAHPLSHYVHPDDRHALNATLASLIHGNELQASYRRLSKSQAGAMVMVSAKLTPILNFDRTAIMEILVLERLVELKERSISSIKKETSGYLSLLRDQADVVVQVTPDCRISFVSDSAYFVWGYRPEELVSKSIWSLVHPDDVKLFGAALLKAPTSKTASVKVAYRRMTLDGDCVVEGVTIIPVMKLGELLHYNMVSRVIEAPCYSSPSTCLSTPGSSFSFSDDDSSFSSASSSPLTSPLTMLPPSRARKAAAAAAHPRKRTSPEPCWNGNPSSSITSTHAFSTNSWDQRNQYPRASLLEDVHAWTSKQMPMVPPVPQFSSIVRSASLRPSNDAEPSRKRIRLCESNEPFNPSLCTCSAWSTSSDDCPHCGLAGPRGDFKDELLVGGGAERLEEEDDMTFHRAW